MSHDAPHQGGNAGPLWVQRTYAAVHAEAGSRLPGADPRGGAPRWHYAEEGGFQPAPRPPEIPARVRGSVGASGDLAARLALRATPQGQRPDFDEDTEEGCNLNSMAERLRTAFLGLGHTLAHFSPSKHTAYVMGRPVQVHVFFFRNSKMPGL